MNNLDPFLSDKIIQVHGIKVGKTLVIEEYTNRRPGENLSRNPLMRCTKSNTSKGRREKEERDEQDEKRIQQGSAKAFLLSDPFESWFGWPTLFQSRRRMAKSGSASTYATSTRHAPKMIFSCTGSTGCESFSFMDGYSGYNQIRMHHSDIDKTAFYTPFGTYACRFGLQNAFATGLWQQFGMTSFMISWKTM